jgi:hypothetical protein
MHSEGKVGLLHRIFQHSFSPGQSCPVKIIITTRPLLQIRDGIRPGGRMAPHTAIELEDDNVNGDMKQFIEGEMEGISKIREYQPHLRQSTERALREGMDGMFLWTSHMIEQLRTTSPAGVAEVLSTCPAIVEKLYRQLLPSATPYSPFFQKGHEMGCIWRSTVAGS